MSNNKIHFSKKLPMQQPVGATFFVTCALKGAIAPSALSSVTTDYHRNLDSIDHTESVKEVDNQKLLANRNYVQHIDQLLHESNGPTFLAAPDVARILLARIESYHMRYYKLLALSIMPNHFHMLIDTSVQIKGIYNPDSVPDGYVHLNQILKYIKDGAARYINQWKGSIGEQIWESENFELYVNNEEVLNHAAQFILNDPVRMGVAKTHEEHPFTFVNET